jgi:hypothetical protein
LGVFQKWSFIVVVDCGPYVVFSASNVGPSKDFRWTVSITYNPFFAEPQQATTYFVDWHMSEVAFNPYIPYGRGRENGFVAPLFLSEDIDASLKKTY